MNKYKYLFETVSSIVKKNGVDFVYERQFWGMLTDLYPFTYETQLKDVFKECVSDGTLAALVCLGKNRTRTLDFIRKVVDTNSVSKREHLKACLFSVAIAIGSCSEQDFLNFGKAKDKLQKTNQSQPLNQPHSEKSNSGNQRNQNNSKYFVWMVIAILILPGIIVFFSKQSKTKPEKEENMEMADYYKKLAENEELVKNRENFDSTPSIKHVALLDDYKKVIQQVNISSDFKNKEEKTYEFRPFDFLHPVFQLMNNRMEVYAEGEDHKPIKGNIIGGKMYLTETSLDTIPINLKILEWNGKVHIIIMDGAYDKISGLRHYADLLSLYYEKYGIPESQTYDGLPRNPEKHYEPMDILEATHEDNVWTFSKGVIRLGLERIVYVSNEFLDMADQQYEVAKEKSLKREKFVEDSLRKDKILKHREDSLRRIESHEKAIRDI